MNLALPRKSARRSLLFVPGDSQRKIDKITELAADAIILDLEDAVAPSQKDEARRRVCQVLAALDFGPKERLVRLNAPSSPFLQDDLTAVTHARPDGLVIPKVQNAAGLQMIGQTVSQIEQQQQWPSGRITLLAIIESAQALVNLKEIAASTSRLSALIFGAEDFTADIGALRTQAGWEILHARSAVVTNAAAYNLDAIDTVVNDYKDKAGLLADAQMGRNLGFKGKLAIHPAQVEIINTVFSPSPEEIAHAQTILKKAAQHQASGTGVFTIGSTMVDAPIIRAAQNLIERARQCGLIN